MERQIEATYVKNGTVRIGYAHFAFLGQESNWAAEASECADEQGAFWAYHDKLYSSQSGENRGAFNKDKLKQFAADLKLDSGKFNSCVDTGKYSAIIAADFTAFESFGVQSTPTFVVNGRPIAGALPFDSFKQLIDAEITKKK